MKKLSDDYRLRQQRIARDKFRIKRKCRKKRHKCNRYGHSLDRFIPKSDDVVHAPQHLSLQSKKHVGQFITFIRNFNESILKEKIIHINFHNTKHISALAAVYLYSEIDRYKRGIVKIENVSTDQVEYALKRSGLLKLCGFSNTYHDEGLPIIRGINDDGLPKITKYLMERALSHQRLGGDNIDSTERLVNKAISEAMLNVKQHAYPDKDEETRFWWIIADIIDSDLHIVLCDRGVGIPETLKGKRWFMGAGIKNFSEMRDASKIKAAMKYTRSSRTKPSGSGLGSKDIQELIKERGELVIVSGKGHYKLKGNTSQERSFSISYNINGTLIQWRIPIDAEQNNERM